jgi:hypothetical protein
VQPSDRLGRRVQRAGFGRLGTARRPTSRHSTPPPQPDPGGRAPALN